MATKKIDYVVTETKRETKKQRRLTLDLGTFEGVNPKKRYGFGAVEYASIAEALEAYTHITDFSAPAVAFVTDPAHTVSPAVAEAILPRVAGIHMEPEHYFTPVSNAVEAEQNSHRLNVNRVTEAELAKRAEARAAIDAAKKRMSTLEKLIAATPAKVAMIRRRYHAKPAAEACYLIDVTQTIAAAEAEANEAREGIAEAEATIAAAEATIADFEHVRFRVVGEFVKVTKKGDQNTIGYKVHDSKRDAFFTVKTKAAGSMRITPNTFTNRILAELIIEPAIVNAEHGSWYEYGFRFIRSHKTEATAS